MMTYCNNCEASLTETDFDCGRCTQCGHQITTEETAMICNPATFFTSGSDYKSFTYEGGAKLFHWSPYESGLSKSMESNVMFFANDVDHARDVLRRLFEFWISCNEEYVANKAKDNDPHGLMSNAAKEVGILRRYLKSMNKMKFTEVPTNQFFKVSWAMNDDLSVYEK